MIIKYLNLFLFIIVTFNLKGMLELKHTRGIQKIIERNILKKHLPITFCGKINGDAVAIRLLTSNIIQLYKNETHIESTTFYFDNGTLYLHRTNGPLGQLTKDITFFNQNNTTFLKGPSTYLTNSNCYPSSYSLTPKIDYNNNNFEDFFVFELSNLNFIKKQLEQNE